MDKYTQSIREHYERLWNGTPRVLKWTKGPTQDLPEGFSVPQAAQSTLRVYSPHPLPVECSICRGIPVWRTPTSPVM